MKTACSFLNEKVLFKNQWARFLLTTTPQSVVIEAMTSTVSGRLSAVTGEALVPALFTLPVSVHFAKIVESFLVAQP